MGKIESRGRSPVFSSDVPAEDLCNSIYLPANPRYQEPRTRYREKIFSGSAGVHTGPIPDWLKDYTSIKEDMNRTSGDLYESIAGDEEFDLRVKTKSNDEIRNRLLMKMSTLGLWIPTTFRQPSSRTIVIFDWDDTLLCTSYLLSKSIESSPDLLASIHLTRLQKSVVISTQTHLLSVSLSVGETYIITNAQKGWVESSAGTWLPGVIPLLEKITVVSAREEYEEKYPCDYHQWKVMAFMEIPEKLGTDVPFTQSVTNLIVLGDSMVEIDAAHTLKNCYERAYIKTVKFQSSPTPEDLTKQLDLVAHQFSEICSSAKDMTIRLERYSLFRRFGNR